MKLCLPSLDHHHHHDTVQRKSPSWLLKFAWIFQRNFRSYIRNYGNAAARLAVTIGIAVIAGILYQDLAAVKSPQTLQNIFGKSSTPMTATRDSLRPHE